VLTSAGPSAVQAQLFLTADDSVSAGATTPPGPPSAGVGNGFGSMTGDGVTFSWDTDVNAGAVLDVAGGSCMGTTDVAVVYLDSVAGGFADTSGFMDVAFPQPAAVSAGGTSTGPNTAPLTFAPGFEADYAIAFTNPAAGTAPGAYLYELVAGGPHLATPLVAPQVGGPGGTCAAAAALDCDDSNLCTADACDATTGCSHTDVASCCNVDVDCDDGDVCTTDTCSGPGGTCASGAMTGCCTTDAACDDSNLCTGDACNLSTHLCERTAVAGCCTVDADCNDSNACTTDTCDASTGSCGNAAITGCCVADADRDDGNTCSLDTCDGSTMTCANDAIAGCCTADTECDDSEPCTTDTCNVATAGCEHAALAMCGADDGMPDAGMDAGDDGGLDDGGTDIGDGAIAIPDSGEPDAGGRTSGGGCGSVPGPNGNRAPFALGLLVAAVVFARRRRRTRR